MFQILILFLSYLSTSLGADCSNPLLSTLSITAASGGPISVSGINYCSRLKDGTTSSCCTAATINTLQDYQDNILNTIQTMTIARDKYLSQNLKTYSAKLLNAFYDYMNAYRNLLSKTEAYKGSHETLAESLALVQQSIILSGTYLESYQTARAKCYKRMILLQSDAYCLACDARYADRGVDASGTVTISPNLCTKIQNDCVEYLNYAYVMAKIITTERYYKTLTDYTKLFKDIYDGKTAVPGDTTKLPDAYNSFTPTKVSQAMISLDDDCANVTEKSTCTWVCENLIVDGVLDKDTLVAGGAISDTTITISGRRLEGKEERKRVLDVGGWEPDENEAGTKISISSDPAGILFEYSLRPLFGILAFVFIFVAV